MPKRLVCIKATSSATQEMDMYRDEMKETENRTLIDYYIF